MEFKSLSKRARTYWIIVNALITAFTLGVSAGIIFSMEQSSVMLVVGLSLGIPVIILSAFLIIWPFLKYKFYSYYYDDERVIIKRGVIFRHTIVIPVCQIQDLHVFEGPIMMIFKLKGVIFSTAGSNFELTCLDGEVAEKIVIEIEEYLKKRVEVLANEKV